MKAYGKRRADGGCCPGHDKYPKETYTRKPSTASRRNMDRGRKKRARRILSADCNVRALDNGWFGVV